MKVLRVKEREFGEMIASKLGFPNNEALDAVELAVKAAVRLAAALPRGFNVVDRKMSGVVTVNGLSVFVATVGDGQHLPNYVILYLDENEDLRSWSPTTNGNLAAIDVVLGPCGVIDDEVGEKLTSTIIHAYARTVYDVFIHQVQPVNKQVDESTEANDAQRDSGSACKPTYKATATSANDNKDEDDDSPHFSIDDDALTPVKIDGDLEQQVLDAQSVASGGWYASSDIDAFKRKLIEVAETADLDSSASFEFALVKGLAEEEHDDIELVMKDLSEVEFDMENNSFEDVYGIGSLTLGFHVINGLAFMLGNAGGDWEAPVVYALYLDNKGKLRGYVPSHGNTYCLEAKAAYGSVYPNDVKDGKSLSASQFEQKYGGEVNVSADYEEILKDIVKHIAVK